MRKIKSRIVGVKTYEAEPLTAEIARLIEQKTPIKAVSPIIYTERRDGVKPEFDIRTDRWEIAETMMGHKHKSDIAKRDSVGDIATPGNTATE